MVGIKLNESGLLYFKPVFLPKYVFCFGQDFNNPFSVNRRLLNRHANDKIIGLHRSEAFNLFSEDLEVIGKDIVFVRLTHLRSERPGFFNFTQAKVVESQLQLRREKVRVHFKGPQLTAGTFTVTVLSGKHPTDEIVDLGVACPDKEGLIPKTVETGLVVKLQFRQHSPVGSRPWLERVHLLNQVENSLGLLEKLEVNGSFRLKEKRSCVKRSGFDHLAEVALSRLAVVGEKGSRQSEEQIGIIGLQLQASLEFGSGSTVVVFLQRKLSRREIRLDYAVRDVLSLRFGRLGLPVVFVQHHTGISSKNESGLTKFNVVTRGSFASRHRGGSAIDSGKHLCRLFFTPETSEQIIRSQ